MAENIYEKAEEVVEEVIVDDEKHVAKDILCAVKKYWWKALIGVGTTVAVFCAGVLVGGREDQILDVAAELPEEVPFDDAIEI